MATDTQPLSERVNWVLNILLLIFLLIALRIWYLTQVIHEEHLEKSRIPQNRQVVLKAERGTIRDRFNLPLAVNTVQYNAAVLYSEIRELPSLAWESDEQGQKHRTYPRREYIRQLSKLLGDELGMTAERVEDLIHARAALFHQVPYVIARDISEETFYRLRMLQKDWRGVHAERAPKRVYPRGRVASDLVGYLGAINREEYDGILDEIKNLREFIRESDLGHLVDPPEGIHSTSEARWRLQDLEDRAYAISDQVGKSGIEGQFEERLRGFRGRTAYYSDARGNFLRELPGAQEAIPGQRLLLTISAELQEYAEQLLIQQERMRDGRCRVFDRRTGTYRPLKEPWIKGGAVVAMDPNTGELLALASYPRFDPNDFVPSGDAEIQEQKQSAVQRWFETDGYLGEIWDGQQPLMREGYTPSRGFYEDELPLTWRNYLELILPERNPVYQRFQEKNTIGDAFDVIMAEEELDLESYDDKLLLDLCRLCVDERRFSPQLLESVENRSLDDYHRDAQRLVTVWRAMKSMMRALFAETRFARWREDYGPAYLRHKRKQEKQAGRYARPYLDYYDRMERYMFEAFWQINRWPLLSAFVMGRLPLGVPEDLAPYLQHVLEWHDELSQGAHGGEPWLDDYLSLRDTVLTLDSRVGLEYLQSMRAYEELSRPLIGRYRNMRRDGAQQLEKHLAAAFYPVYGYGFMRPQAYRQATTPGSVYKLVTGYASLLQEWEEQGPQARALPLFEMIDERRRLPGGKGWIVGYTLGGQPIPQQYKGGRLIRTLTRNVGRVDLQRALEMSANPYFSLLAGDHLNDPEQLNDAAKALGYGARTGVDLPGELSGRLPKDLKTNRSGLYAAAIGQHTLVVTPLQTAVMLSTIANGGKVMQPQILRLAAGKLPVRQADPVFSKEQFLYQRSLALMGITFPLFSGVEGVEGVHQVYPVESRVVRSVPMPAPIRDPLLEGMERVVKHARTAGKPGLLQMYRGYPGSLRSFLELDGKFIAKSSTAEAVEAVDLDPKDGTRTYNHIWAGTVSFPPVNADNQSSVMLMKDQYGAPELVVVVYLRFGGYGKQAMPLAAQIVDKWREIKARQEA